jgi:hypothetical protein
MSQPGSDLSLLDNFEAGEQLPDTAEATLSFSWDIRMGVRYIFSKLFRKASFTGGIPTKSIDALDPSDYG